MEADNMFKLYSILVIRGRVIRRIIPEKVKLQLVLEEVPLLVLNDVKPVILGNPQNIINLGAISANKSQI